MAEVEILTEQITQLRQLDYRCGDLEQAAAVGGEALRTAAELDSHRTLDRLRTLQRQVRPLCSASPHLADLDERITGFRTRTARRHQQDNAL